MNINEFAYHFLLKGFLYFKRRNYSICQSYSGGPRYYINAKLDEFWREYVKMDPNTRYFYEIIPADTPCRLHFDLEFEKTGKNEHVKPEVKLGFLTKSEYIVTKDEIVWKKISRLVIRYSRSEKFSSERNMERLFEIWRHEFQSLKKFSVFHALQSVPS